MADFTFDVHRVIPNPMNYNTLITEMEGMKEKRRLKTTLGWRSWNVEIYGRLVSEKDAIVAHYQGQYGATTPFNWVVTPSFFENGNTYYVRYAQFDYTSVTSKRMGNVFDFKIEFKEII